MRRWAIPAVAAVAAVVLAILMRGTPEGGYPAPRVTGSYSVAGGGPLRRGAVVTADEGTATLVLGGYCEVRLEPGTTVRLEGAERAEAVSLDEGSLTCEVDRSTARPAPSRSGPRRGPSPPRGPGS